MDYPDPQSEPIDPRSAPLSDARGARPSSSDPRSSLPAVSSLLEEPAIRDAIARHSYPLTLEAIQEALAAMRRRLRPGDAAPSRETALAAVFEALAALERQRIRPVVNATGVLLHTNLGRAPLPKAAAEALARAWRCCNLELDMETGLRGKRHSMCERLLCKLTGAEAALIVNNNAAATLLILDGLCKGREVVISRGQLIEIGGSFRLPDCIHQSGAIMVEVGTTNKTHLRDYKAAIGENTGALLRVNPSNYRIIGFAEQVPIGDMVALKKGKADLLVIDDLGCGALIDLSPFGLPKEPTVQESVAAGADIACFSGDKMIGGPQAGIIVGKKELIQRLRMDPLTRMLRVDKLTDMALEATLRLFLDPKRLLRENPTLRMLTTPVEELRKKARAVVRGAGGRGTKSKGKAQGLQLEIVESEAAMGGGSLPGTNIPSAAVAARHDAMRPDQFSCRLREHDPPVIVRIQEDRVLLDMRTLLEGEERIVAEALRGMADDAR